MISMNNKTNKNSGLDQLFSSRLNLSVNHHIKGIFIDELQ